MLARRDEKGATPDVCVSVTGKTFQLACYPRSHTAGRAREARREAVTGWRLSEWSPIAGVEVCVSFRNCTCATRMGRRHAGRRRWLRDCGKPCKASPAYRPIAY